ncbi:MAG: DUF3365 domain-containing protein [Polyangiales bacterium]
MLRIALFLSLIVALPACTGSKLNEAKWKAAGAEAVLPFKQSLKGALVSGLEGGPVAAISACRVEAPNLAAQASLGGVKVGRASGKLRNPSNAAKPWMQPILDVYETDPERREPAVVAIDKDTVGYVEPIFMQPLCVACHGATLAPDLETKLGELYPTDQATGYAAGDFRGIFWAELPRN